MPYPPDEILAEVGRVSIAGARLDYQLFQVWRHLDPDLRDAGGKKATNHRARVLAARRRPNQYRHVIKARAQEYLVDEWAAYVLHEVDDQDRVRAERDSLIHQDWVFRGDPAHAAYSGPNFFELSEDKQADAMDEEERRAISAEGWLALGKDEPDFLSAAQAIEQLIDIERRLRQMTGRLSNCTNSIAQLREQFWPGRKGPDLRGTFTGLEYFVLPVHHHPPDPGLLIAWERHGGVRWAWVMVVIDRPGRSAAVIQRWFHERDVVAVAPSRPISSDRNRWHLGWFDDDGAAGDRRHGR